MIYVYSFLFAGFVCVLGQTILDNTKLTPGHVTALFVVIGATLDTFSIYDKIVEWAGGGALVPITSFGHLLLHGALEKAHEHGILGLSMGMFDLASTGIIAAMVIAFVLSLIFKPKH